MIRRVFRIFLGSLCLLLIVLNLFVHAILTFVVGFFVWIIPDHLKISIYGQRFVLLIPLSWAQFNFWILNISAYGKWDIQAVSPLAKDKWYMLVSNHQSWFDILVLGSIFCRVIPPLKFFMKKELLWTLPVAGVSCYFLGYPFMERHTPSDIRKNPALKGKDIETTKQACEKFKRLPTTVINFVEGTRFSEEKRLAQQSPYRHLLKPKSAGIAIVINEMREHLAGILNVSINYGTPRISLFNLLSGNFKKLSVHYEVLPITATMLGNYYEDRVFRRNFQQWLNDLWSRKDQLLDELNHDL